MNASSSKSQSLELNCILQILNCDDSYKLQMISVKDDFIDLSAMS